MNLLSPRSIKEILSRYSAAPSKRFGQNFLINPGVLKKIIEAAALDRGDIVLEIGPGIGTLTQELAKYAKKVIAIEKDRKMVEILKETLVDFKNVEIIEGDILKFPISSLFVIPAKAGIQTGSPRIKYGASLVKPGMTKLDYKVIANLPYYITSPVIRKFLEADAKPNEMVLMVQKEVAQRICAKPPDMSLLAVSVQFYAEPKIISYVSKGSFWPSPKVDSAIIKISPRDKKPEIDIPLFFKIVHAGFSSPRKQLAGNLVKNLKIERPAIEAVLKKAGIKPEQRAETLTVTNWISLTKLVAPCL
ncbi:MAG: 16S rRNA (adenine(1518)-N(6)/adenine(1519)-N(6))-dimethyltransferase RsmA [bacterium]